MTRTNKSARNAGTGHETKIANYLALHVDDRIERRTKNGNKDRGDVSGLRHMGLRVVVECKDRGGQFFIGSWLTETEVERGNDDAGIGVVVAKRRGTTDPGDQVVVCTVRDLVALLTGERP
jgi:hypothetical protein